MMIKIGVFVAALGLLAAACSGDAESITVYSGRS